MERKKKPNKLLRLIIALIVLGGIGYFGFIGYINYLKSPVSSSTEKIAIVVNPGDTVTDVAKLLEEKGIIRSAFAFKMSAKDAGFTGVPIVTGKQSPVTIPPLSPGKLFPSHDIVTGKQFPVTIGGRIVTGKHRDWETS